MKLPIILAFSGFLCLSVCQAEDLVLNDGTVLQDAEITKTNPAGFTVLHKSGVAKVLFTNVGPELQKKYGYDKEKAAEFLKTTDQIASEKRLEFEKRLAEEEKVLRVQKEAYKYKLAQEANRKKQEYERAQWPQLRDTDATLKRSTHVRVRDLEFQIRQLKARENPKDGLQSLRNRRMMELQKELQLAEKEAEASYETQKALKKTQEDLKELEKKVEDVKAQSGEKQDPTPPQ